MALAGRYPRMAPSPEKRNYYEVLHVSPDAPVEIIRGSYRTLMQQLKHHPDLGGDTVTAALINEAYAVLSDPARRAEYDTRLSILEQLSRGMPEDTWVDESYVTADRILDPLRECVFCAAPHEHGKVIEVDASCKECASPLYAAERLRNESADKRAVSRIDKRQAITFFTHWPQRKGFAGHTEDISLSGLRFVTKWNLAKGQRLKIVSGVVEAVARVTNCTQERHGWTTVCVAGVSFVTLRFVRSVGGFVSEQV